MFIVVSYICSYAKYLLKCTNFIVLTFSLSMIRSRHFKMTVCTKRPGVSAVFGCLGNLVRNTVGR